MRQLTGLDHIVSELDNARRTLFGLTVSERPSPGKQVADPEIEKALNAQQKSKSSALMRVNHCGEVCAQALYRGQAFTSQQPKVRETLYQAAREEQDHLNWCEQRIDELGGRRSLLNPLFYGLSFAMGCLLGRTSQGNNLGFVEATEAQVCEHLKQHLTQLPEQDESSRVILTQMLEDEKRHGDQAIQAGGQVYPEMVKNTMSQLAKIMTKTTYYI